MTADRLPATSRRADYGPYRILGYPGRDLEVNIRELEPIARQLEIAVFGVERPYAIEDVAHNFRNGGSMTVVVSNVTGELLGYSSQRLLVPRLEGHNLRILFTTTRAMVRSAQGEGIGPETLRFSVNMHSPDIVAGIMGWSPPVAAYYNSGVIDELSGEQRIEAEAGIETTGDEELDEIKKQISRVRLYPFFRPYTQSPIMASALRYVLQQSRYNAHTFDPESGLMKELWDKDSNMLLQPDKVSRRIKVIDELLQNNFDCNPTTGDAIVVMGPKSGWRAFGD